ncbi:RAMP superfamily CRISPR-associated protein [Pelodictyon phaeoclathratiforme]|jgi:CRISPR/Cas system CSM-associated protein Csm5 (group 7 of RAMP superfamily)|uniref:CRISPR system Cms protein Csm5 n=1 Tax=Pelodictyon phaeoclathratiforme (strain DSM 5477 / BU-1) TaxID=324925 RepID=B4SEV9_PELPB|nr:RAMP superfamily CRISPR-associated protein [Pelodictyon phaeoclathratiforme]ACF44635.1 hypothetical protein Ppha_2450 [Pelodictyon phaeoclathratiforme BU-1]MBV5288940.1 hypothetical protein [Pelodictyon phaeoclathratiforme]
MTYEDKIERRTIRLTAVTPVHIKGKDIDYGQGFVRRDNYSAYAIDHMRLGKYLLSKGKFEVYLEEIDGLINRRKFKDFDFQKFLQTHNLYNINNPETHRELIDAGVFKAIVGSTNNKQFVRDGMLRAFIPGSTIKGFIRVACIYEHFKNKVFLKWEEFENEIRDYDKSLIDSFRFISVTDSRELDIQSIKDETVSIVSRNIREETVLPKTEEGEGRIIEFGKIKLQIGDTRFYDIDESLTNRFRLKTGVVISSYKLDSKGKKVIDLTIKDENISRGQSDLVKIVALNFKSDEDLECFNGETEFDIILNKNPANTPFKSIENLIHVLDSFSKNIWDLETKYLSQITENANNIEKIKKFYDGKRIANARIGFGTGLISKTPDGILEETVLTELVNALFQPMKPMPHTRPKSRKVISSSSEAVLPLGWIKLDIKP